MLTFKEYLLEIGNTKDGVTRLVNYVPKAGKTLAGMSAAEKQKRQHMMTKAMGKVMNSPYGKEEISKYRAMQEDWQRAVLRKHGSVKPGHWNGQKFVIDLTKQDAVGFDHKRCKSINAQVEVNGKVVAGGLKKLDEANKYDYEWDNDNLGYHVTKNGERVKDGFHKAKSTFDRSAADESAKKHAQKLKVAEIKAEKEQRFNDVQMNKPLSEIEKRWVELHKRVKTLNHDELKKYVDYGQVVRKSLRDGSHPAVKK